LRENTGPWQDFEVVEGDNKGDIVGVRRKSEGPDGKVFTPFDLEKLPNELL